VWTAPFVQGFIWIDSDRCGLRSCVRPFDAVRMTAGPDEVRVPGSQSHYRALKPRQYLGVSRLRSLLIIINHIALTVRSSSAWLPRFVSTHAIVGARYVSPRASTAQAIRALLLAMATVTTRAGLRSSSDRTQAPVADVLELARRMTEVAPITSSFHR